MKEVVVSFGSIDERRISFAQAG